MLRLLHDGDKSKTELAEELGVTNTTVTKWMFLLGSDKPKMPGRLVYISSWRQGPRGNPAALWTYGFEMPDAVKPKPLTGTQYAQRYRAKKRGHLQLVVGGISESSKT